MRCAVYGGLFAAVLATSSAAGQTKAKMSSLEAATSSLTRLEDSWATALVRRDRATFERLLGPKFVYTEDTTTMDRATVIRETFGADTVTEAHNEHMEVHIFSNVGVVTGWLIVKGRSKGAPFEHRYRFTDTWIPRSGSWQIVAAQDYLLPTRK